jgi:hypothetical protein
MGGGAFRRMCMVRAALLKNWCAQWSGELLGEVEVDIARVESTRRPVTAIDTPKREFKRGRKCCLQTQEVQFCGFFHSSSLSRNATIVHNSLHQGIATGLIEQCAGEF